MSTCPEEGKCQHVLVSACLAAEAVFTTTHLHVLEGGGCWGEFLPSPCLLQQLHVGWCDGADSQVRVLGLLQGHGWHLNTAEHSQQGSR